MRELNISLERYCVALTICSEVSLSVFLYFSWRLNEERRLLDLCVAVASLLAFKSSSVLPSSVGFLWSRSACFSGLFGGLLGSLDGWLPDVVSWSCNNNVVYQIIS